MRLSKLLCGGIGLALLTASAGVAAQEAPAPKIAHPAITLLDAEGVNVLKSKAPISTRQTCGKCHDYDFITDSFHFQQGKNEMDPKLLASHGVAPFNSSPGMFGKFSIIPNRQLTHAGVTDISDVDMSQAEWLTKCGVCHTGGGISEYDLYGNRYNTPKAVSKGALDPSYTVRDAQTGEVKPWDWQKSGISEGDCFICHVPGASRKDRKERMAKGDFRWADTATLAGTALVEASEDGSLKYKPEAFNPDGTVKPEALNLSDPTLQNCAQCHGFSAKDSTNIQPIVFGDIMRGTEKAGWIYNGAKISDTVSPNIVGKEKMDYPWDVHAAKNLVCIDCHFAPNNPGRKIQSDPEKSLQYRPMQEDIATYLKRPDHNFARGNIPPETVNVTRHYTMRGCNECHDTSKTHAFLPYKQIHFQALTCQTCHIPAVHFWAYRSDEWGFLMDTGTSRITFRGIQGDIVDPDSKVTGFKPAYVVTPDKDGRPQIRPTNLITGVYWFDKAKGRPVFTWQVQKAFFSAHDPDAGWEYRPEIVQAFGDKDGIIDSEHAIYDSPQKIELVKGLLQKYAGITDPELRIEVVPWAMSHSTVGKDQATKQCTDCHSKQSILNRPLDLDNALPKNVPVYFQGAQRPVAKWTDKEVVFDNHSLLASFYIIGNSRVGWIEIIGWLSVFGALLFALIHGGLRIIFGGGHS
jgi:hypothetical protein